MVSWSATGETSDNSLLLQILTILTADREGHVLPSTEIWRAYRLGLEFVNWLSTSRSYSSTRVIASTAFHNGFGPAVRYLFGITYSTLSCPWPIAHTYHYSIYPNLPPCNITQYIYSIIPIIVSVLVDPRQLICSVIIINAFIVTITSLHLKPLSKTIGWLN